MTATPAVPGTPNIPNLAGNEIVSIASGAGAGQTTTQAIANLGGGGLMRATVNISAAQLRAVHSSPITLVPAPGTGKIILVHWFAMFYNFNTVGHDGPGNSAVYIGYPGGTVYLPFLAAFVSVSTVLATVTSLGRSTTAGPGIAWSSASLPAPLSGITDAALVLTGPLDLTAGPIATSSLSAPGSGYAPGDTGSFSDGDGNATYIINTVGAGGAVVTYTVTSGGTGYEPESNSPTSVTTGGGDGNFTVNILTVTPGDGSMQTIVDYEVIAMP